MENSIEKVLILGIERKLTLFDIPKELQSKKLCIEYFKDYKKDLNDINAINTDFLKDNDFMINLVSVRPEIISRLNNYYSEISIIAVSHNKYLIAHVPVTHIQEKIDEFIILNPSYIAQYHEIILSSVDNKNKYYEKIFKLSPDSIIFLPDDVIIKMINNSDILIDNPYLYGLLPQSKRNYVALDIIKTILSKDGMLLRYVEEPTKEMINIAIKQNPAAQMYIQESTSSEY